MRLGGPRPAGPVWRLVVLLVVLGGLALAGHGAAWATGPTPIVVTDAAGRTVALPEPARRIVTNESLALISLALIDPDPVSRLAGWAAPQRLERAMYAAFAKRFPAIADVPVVGSVLAADSSAEEILTRRPDLVLVRIWDPSWSALTRILEAAGVPIIFLEGPKTAALDAGAAAAFSIELLGRAIGRDREGAAVAAFISERFARIASRIAGTASRPDVLVDAQAGAVCCYTPGSGNQLTRFVALAGGRSIAADIVPGYSGQLSAEFVLAADPDVYIATSGPPAAAHPGVVLGTEVSAQSARTSLRDVVGRNLLDQLTSVRQGRAFAVSHQVAISALNLIAIECFAKAIHPDLFRDVDPAETLVEINRRFLAVALDGTFCIGLDEGK